MWKKFDDVMQRKLDPRKIVMADASWCPRTKACAWAGAVLYPDKLLFIVESGTMTDCGSNNSAEGRALAHALDWAIRTGKVKSGDEILLATDSTHVVHVLQEHYRSRRSRNRISRGLPPVKNATDASHRTVITNLARHNGIGFEVIHLPGHSPPAHQKRDLRLKAMAVLDRQARKLMRVRQAMFLQGQVFTAPGR